MLDSAQVVDLALAIYLTQPTNLFIERGWPTFNGVVGTYLNEVNFSLVFRGFIKDWGIVRSDREQTQRK